MLGECEQFFKTSVAVKARASNHHMYKTSLFKLYRYETSTSQPFAASCLNDIVRTGKDFNDCGVLEKVDQKPAV